MGTLSTKNRVVVVCGHYGSGKTNVAVNLAVDAAEKGDTVYLADVDIVNPYFRAADAVSMLEDAGVTPLIPEFANSNVDIPALPPRLSSLISGGDGRIFIDVGGDDGAVVLGRYASLIKDARYDMICVVNMYRPLTATPADAVADMREIEGTYEELTFRPNYEGTDTDDYMHITLTDEEDIPDAIGKLRLIYPNLMCLDYNNSRTRSAGILTDLEDVDRKSPLVLFGEFYEDQNGRPMSDEQKDFAREIMESIWEEKI